MNDIQEYFSNVNVIHALEKQVEQLHKKLAHSQKKRNKYRLQCSALRKYTRMLKYKFDCCQRMKSKYHMKYVTLRDKYVPKYRGNKDVAMDLIALYHNGERTTLKAIAKKCHLAYTTIREYSSEYLKLLGDMKNDKS